MHQPVKLKDEMPHSVAIRADEIKERYPGHETHSALLPGHRAKYSRGGREEPFQPGQLTRSYKPYDPATPHWIDQRETYTPARHEENCVCRQAGRVSNAALLEIDLSRCQLALGLRGRQEAL